MIIPQTHLRFLCLHSSSGSSFLMRGTLKASRTNPSLWPNPGSRRPARRRLQELKPKEWGPRSWKSPSLPNWRVKRTEGRQWKAKNNHRSVTDLFQLLPHQDSFLLWIQFNFNLPVLSHQCFTRCLEFLLSLKLPNNKNNSVLFLLLWELTVATIMFPLAGLQGERGESWAVHS